MTTITALPTAPSRSTDDAATFSSKADTFVAALQTFRTETNLVATETNAASSAATAASAAATSVSGATAWAGTTVSYTLGNAVWSGVNFKTYRLSIASKAANVANTDPSIDTASWTLVNGTGDVITTLAQTLTNKTLTSPTITGTGTAAFGALSYTGTLTGGTGVVNLGSGQFYKDSSGNVGIGTITGGTYKLDVVQASGDGGIAYRSSTRTIGIGMQSSEAAVFWGSTTALTFTSGGAEKMRINANGDLTVGNSAAGLINANSMAFLPSTAWSSFNHISGTASGIAYHYFGLSGSAIGSITQSGTTAVLYNTTSDQRLKNNIVDAPDASALIDSIQVRSFDWISDQSHQRYGMVAQELAQVAPEAVHAPADPDEMMAVDYSKLVPMLIKEVQSLRARVAQLEAV